MHPLWSGWLFNCGAPAAFKQLDHVSKSSVSHAAGPANRWICETLTCNSTTTMNFSKQTGEPSMISRIQGSRNFNLFGICASSTFINLLMNYIISLMTAQSCTLLGLCFVMSERTGNSSAWRVMPDNFETLPNHNGKLKRRWEKTLHQAQGGGKLICIL